jgi:catechol 2,3-dioxygenase-like lactoylglutathione lyase family enzyme
MAMLCGHAHENRGHGTHRFEPVGRLLDFSTGSVAMIKGVHTMFYSSQADELRAFLRDKLGFPATDVGDGWLIFDLPGAEMGCHPTDSPDSAPSGTHAISFYCDDVRQTVAELRGRGVVFTDDIADVGYGLATHFRVPGDFEIELYQPHYQKPRAK